MNTAVQSYAYPTANFKNNFHPVIYTDRMKTSIVIDDIMMLEGDGNYTHVHLINGKKILISKTLKDFCERFQQYDFARIRKSYLINLNYLKDVELSGDVSVTMQTGQRIEISRRRKTEFQQQLRSFKQRK
ncbi:MAG: LytTR family DNA-binding domain-containing protein [Bacteroidota bacterium]|jgi:two-component system LytT family response regulator